MRKQVIRYKFINDYPDLIRALWHKKFFFAKQSPTDKGVIGRSSSLGHPKQLLRYAPMARALTARHS